MTRTTEAPRHISGLRGTRYGEILLISPSGNGSDGLKAAVYNTLGLNDCPQDWWNGLDPGSLAEQFKVPMVLLNGPRYWAIDELTAYAVGGVTTFDGVDARLVAEVDIPAETAPTGATPRKPYVDIMVKRDTEYLLTAGKPIYALNASDGRTYVLQAYAHIVDDSLTLDSLATLGDRLSLPEGWRFEVRTPEEDLRVRTVDGEAHVVQDELQNTYMFLAR
ncbi:hypothetical protein ABZ532_18150 [Streptomyces sp. NPDC019396]|uniref:hypothetical protein n=1 Tax=Streptomyces sp. NPDC019396 TaxID=3154687 RepID=UPI0033DFBDDC